LNSRGLKLQFQNENLKTAAAYAKSLFLFIQSALVDYVSHEALKISNQPTERNTSNFIMRQCHRALLGPV
jgi:hypothetical protein